MLSTLTRVLFVIIAISTTILTTCTSAGSSTDHAEVRSVDANVAGNILEINWDVAANTDLDKVQHFDVELVYKGAVIASRYPKAGKTRVNIPISAVPEGEYTIGVAVVDTNMQKGKPVLHTINLSAANIQALPPVVSSYTLQTALKTEDSSTVTMSWAVLDTGRIYDGSTADVVSQTIYWKAGDAVSTQDYDGIAGDITADYYTVEGLKAGTLYAFLLEVKNNARLTTISSVEVITTATQKTVMPGTVILTRDNISTISKRDIAYITLEFTPPYAGSDPWGKSLSISHYVVYWKAGLSEGSSFAVEEADAHLHTSATELTSADKVSIEISGLETDTGYGLILEATNGESYTSTSIATRVQTNPASPARPAAVQGLKVSATQKAGARISWEVADAEKLGITEEGTPANFKQYIVYWEEVDINIGYIPYGEGGIVSLKPGSGRKYIRDIHSNSLTLGAADGLRGGMLYIIEVIVENDTASMMSKSIGVTQRVRILDRTTYPGDFVLDESNVVLGAGEFAPTITLTFTVPNTGTNFAGASLGIDKYLVYTKANFTSTTFSKDEATRVLKVDATEVTDGNTVTIVLEYLLLGTNYGIMLELHRSVGTSMLSNTISKRTHDPAPPPITGLRVESASDEISLSVSWDAADANNMGTHRNGAPANFKQYIIYWSSMSEVLDITDTDRRIVVTDITRNSVDIPAGRGVNIDGAITAWDPHDSSPILQGATQYAVALVVENTNKDDNARSIPETERATTPDLSAAPEGVRNITKGASHTVLGGIRVEWDAEDPGKDVHGNAVDSIYEVYVAKHGDVSLNPSLIIAGAGATTQVYSTTETHYELTELDAATDYDIVIVAINSDNLTLKTISDVQKLRSNGVLNLEIIEADQENVSGKTIARNIGSAISLTASIRVDNIPATIFWESSDVSIVNIPEESTGQKSIVITPLRGGTVELTVHSVVDPSKRVSVTLRVPYPASDLNIVVTDYLAEDNIRHNYVLLEIKIGEGSPNLDNFRLTLKESSKNAPGSSDISGDGVRLRNIKSDPIYVLLFSILGEEPDYIGKAPLLAEESVEPGVLPGLLVPGTEYTLYGAEADGSRVYNLGSYGTDSFNISEFSGAEDAVEFLDTAVYTESTYFSLGTAESRIKITARSTEPTLIPSSMKVKGDNPITHAYPRIGRDKGTVLTGYEWKVPLEQLVAMFWSKGEYDGSFSFGGNKGAADKIARAEFTSLGSLRIPSDDSTKNARIITPVYDNYGVAAKAADKRSTHLYMLLGPRQLKTSPGPGIVNVRRITTWGAPRRGVSWTSQLSFTMTYASDRSVITFVLEE